MSLLLPSVLPFGDLAVEETWLAFDGPKLFVARNRTGQSFLFNAIDEDEESISYLAVAMSEKRRAMVRSGGLGLRAAFTAPEGGVFRVTCDYELGEARAELVEVERLSDAELPTDDAYVSVPTETLPSFHPDTLASRALAEGRTLVGLRLNPPTLARSEYPVRPLSDALRAMQSLAEAMVQEESGTTTVRGPLPAQVIEDGELAVLDLEAASFVAILAPSRSARSTPSMPSLGFEMPTTAAALERAHSLLRAVASSEHDPEILRSSIQGLGVRAVTKIRDLLEVALDQNTPLTVYVAPPGGPVEEVRVSTGDASAGVLVLSERDASLEEIVLESAWIVGVNLRTWVFELHDPTAEPNKFSGRVTEHARSQIEGLPTGEAHRYVAEIVSESSFSDLTDEVKVRYSLKSIRPAGEHVAGVNEAKGDDATTGLGGHPAPLG